MNATDPTPHTVLVPIDGSPLSHKALRHALRTFPDASITVLHVIDLFDPGYGVDAAYEPAIGSDVWYEQARETAEERFEEAEAIADGYDGEIETESEIGDPERIIVEFAEEEGVDQIVLGTHGRPDEERRIYGSIAEGVARRATVPVTLVR